MCADMLQAKEKGKNICGWMLVVGSCGLGLGQPRGLGLTSGPHTQTASESDTEVSSRDATAPVTVKVHNTNPSSSSVK